MDRRDFIALGCAATALGFHSTSGFAAAKRGAKGYLRTNWGRDPFSLGSYSYIAKGARQSDTRALAEPVGERLFFAGEATHPSYNSTVHAAYESGLFAASSVAKTPATSVAVIGGGISGLAAAHHLSRQGRKITVLEARNRIGGRIWTDRSLGYPVDLGASWIHGTRNNPLAKLAREARIKTVATDHSSYVIRGKNGRQLADRQAPSWLSEVIEIQHGFGAASSDINMRAYWHDRDYDGQEVVFPNGYSGILEGLGGAAQLRLNWQVKSLTHSSAGVDVTNVGGQTLAFDAVIVTVPLAVLKASRITFDPPLPVAKRRAVERLGMGLLDKVYLLYDQVFWDPKATWIITPDNGLPVGQFNQWLNYVPLTGAPILLAFNAADPARTLSGLSNRDIVARAQSVLAKAYP